MSDVVEAMARAIYCDSGWRRDGWENLTDEAKNNWRNHARAAIRACHDAGGLVVGKMPKEKAEPGHSAYAVGYARGHNAALAAVRAAAVEVE